MQEDEVDVGGRPVCLVGLQTVIDTLTATVHDTRFMLFADTHTRDDCAGLHLSLGDFMHYSPYLAHDKPHASDVVTVHLPVSAAAGL
jgi:hypothetical protein